MSKIEIPSLANLGVTSPPSTAVPLNTPVAPTTEPRVDLENGVIFSSKLTDGKLILSKDRKATLKSAQRHPEFFQELVSDYISRAQIAEEKSRAWSERRDVLKMYLNPAKPAGVIEKGPRKGKHRRAVEAGRYINVTGTGTGSGASFTKKQALVFLQNIQAFANLVQSMPDFDSEVESEEE